MLRVVDEIESISDSCLNMARAMYRIQHKKLELTPEMKKNILVMYSLLDEAFDLMIANLDKDHKEVDKISTDSIEKKINRFRNKLRKQHVKDIENDVYSYQVGTLYKDIFSESEKLGDYIYDTNMSLIEYVES